MRNVDLIVIHCSATREDINYSLESLERDHRARGFSKAGYHFYILKDGTINSCRKIDEIGAHVVGYNSRSIGICYEGGLDSKSKPKDTRTEEQKKAIMQCISEVLFVVPTIKKIVGHRDLSPDTNGNGVVEPDEWVKLCPCFDATEEYKHLIK